MPNTATLNASSVSNVAGVGSVAWSNTANAVGSDTVSGATVNVSGPSQSNYLVGYFSHGLAAGDTITGIVAAYHGSATLNDSDAPQEQQIRIFKGSTPGSTELALGASGKLPQVGAWSADKGTSTTIGGHGSITGADTIGLGVSIAGNDPSDSATINAFRAVIYYTSASGRLLSIRRRIGVK
jgi:hypothetical protein